MKVITKQDKQDRFEINGNIYRLTADLLHQKVTVIHDMNYPFDVYQDKFGNYILCKCEPYPCFDSSDRMHENRYYRSYMICSTKDEVIEKYKYILEHDPGCRADEDTPSFLAPLIYVDDGKSTICIMTDSDKKNKPPLKSKVSFWNSTGLLLATMRKKTIQMKTKCLIASPMKSYLLFSFAFLLPLMISANNPEGIVDGNNRFAFKLFREVKGSATENLFYSPFSISTALAMVYAGSRNETALQISQTMDFQPDAKFNSDYKKLLGKLNKGTAGKIKLNIANGLWAQKDYKFLDSYFELVKSNYNSEVTNVDFFDPAEREETRKEINRWVEETTNDKIKDLLSQNDLTSLTRLVLVNAIYFYGDWKEPFEKESTRPRAFILTDGNQINVPFMNQHKSYNYYEDSNLQAIEIPYKNNKVSMVIFLPNKNNGIVEFEKLFDYKYYLDIIASFQTTEVRLSLPEFQTTFKINLGSTLSQMGMPLAFFPDSADFSGMTGKRDLYISQVIHQAFINVDEQGTEAAAATAVVMMTTSARPSPYIKVFDADHPFVFLIKDTATGSILFMGTIMKPEVSK
jgi:serpin B